MHCSETAALVCCPAELSGLDVELSQIDAVMGHDLRERLGEIATPTLCVAALDNQITPPGLTEELAAGIPGAELQLFIAADISARLLRLKTTTPAWAHS